jgi:hypothetical protein
MDDTLVLTDEKVLALAQATLAEHLDLHAEGYKCTTKDLLEELLGIAVTQGTLSSVCAGLATRPDPDTVGLYLQEQLTVKKLPQLQAELNAALVAQLPERLHRRKVCIAIDMHDRCYYGTTSQDDGLWVGGEAQDGTTRFYRIASAYGLVHHERRTLGICFVTPDLSTVDVVTCLIKQIQAQNMAIELLLLDRGFGSVAVLRYLQDQKLPALIAGTIRGKQGGTRALCHGQASYRTQYTFLKDTPEAFTAEIAVCRVFTTAKRPKRHKAKGKWHLFILIHVDLSIRQARRLYHRRFGIESGYRSGIKVRGGTTSPNPAYRFLLMAIPLLLCNLWVLLRWLFTQVPRRGHRKIAEERFRLTRFASFIWQAIQRHRGYLDHIVAVVAPIG